MPSTGDSRGAARVPRVPRVLHVDAGRTWRGGQRQVLFLADGLRGHGYESLVVAAPESPLLERARARGLATAAIAMRGDLDLRAVRRLRTLMRCWRPDVVHAHDARSHAIAMLALLGRRGARTPLVVTRRVAFPIKGARLKYGPRVARFVAVSGAVREVLAAGGVDPSRTVVVHSGAPAPAPDLQPRDWRRERGWPADAIVCGVVGAMTAEKGLHDVETVCAALPDDLRARVRIVFMGGDQPPAATTIGGVDAWAPGFVDAIHAGTAGLDVLWHPSRSEGFPGAVIDAMALGVVPVAYAVGGLPELVEHERSGLLAPAGDVQAFAREARRLVTDPALRAMLAAGARLRAARFGIEPMVAGNARLYASLLAERAPRAGDGSATER